MAEIINAGELATYLRGEAQESDLALLVELANGLVSDALGSAVAPYPTRVRTITFEVAARAWRNPNGYASETSDDYTYRRDADSRAAGIYLTDAERAELAGVGAGARVMRAGSIAVTSPWDAP